MSAYGRIVNVQVSRNEGGEVVADNWRGVFHCFMALEDKRIIALVENTKGEMKYAPLHTLRFEHPMEY